MTRERRVEDTTCKKKKKVKVLRIGGEERKKENRKRSGSLKRTSQLAAVKNELCVKDTNSRETKK